jgi:hypothetical protein
VGGATTIKQPGVVASLHASMTTATIILPVQHQVL